MATPTGAKHRDLEQRLRDLEDDVRTLRGQALTRRAMGVSAGDFTVTGTGRVSVSAGGQITVTDDTGTRVLDAGADGLARPYVGWSTYVQAHTLTGSGTWTTLQGAQGFTQHPTLEVSVDAFTEMNASGRFRVGYSPDLAGGAPFTYYGDTLLSAGTAADAYVVTIPVVADFTDRAGLILQARTECGVGSIGVRLNYVIGTE